MSGRKAQATTCTADWCICNMVSAAGGNYQALSELPLQQCATGSGMPAKLCYQVRSCHRSGFAVAHTHQHTPSICSSIYPSVHQRATPTKKVQAELPNQQVFLSKQGNVPSTETHIITHKQAVDSLYPKGQNFCIGDGWKHTFVNSFTSSKEKEKRLCFPIIILQLPVAANEERRKCNKDFRNPL